MVQRDLVKAARPRHIRPAVPHMRDVGLIPAGDHRHDGGAHPPQIQIVRSGVENFDVGGGHSGFQHMAQGGFGHAVPVGIHNPVGDDFDGDRAGDVSAVGAAHTVADDREAGGIRQFPADKGILIGRPHTAGVASADDLHRCIPLSAVDVSSRSRPRSCPQEARISAPRVRRTVTLMPRFDRMEQNALCLSRVLRLIPLPSTSFAGITLTWQRLPRSRPANSSAQPSLSLTPPMRAYSYETRRPVTSPYSRQAASSSSTG